VVGLVVPQHPVAMKEKAMIARRTSRGFTLIELLVVVAIIALLIAILLPALSQVKIRANTARCLVNARSMANAVNMYIADWKKIFPFSDDQPLSWTQLLYNGGIAAGAGGTVNVNTTAGYGALDKIRFCPEATDYGKNAGAMNTLFGDAHSAWSNSPLTGGNTSLPFGSSYGLNGWVYAYEGSDSLLSSLDGNAPASSFYHVNRGDASPTDTPIFADCNWRHVFAKPTDTIPGGATLNNPGPVDIGNHPIARMLMDRHNMQINVSFLDNHAETVGLRNLYSLKWSPNWVVPASTPLPNP
jgi:prepilin-type N-terminal cleavage/methylation domain-containing protein